MNKHSNWTEEEIKILKDNYCCSSKKEIIELLPNRNYQGITSKASSLGIKKEKRWSNKEVEILKKCYEDGMKIKDIEDVFNSKYSYSSIQVKLNKLGCKSREFWTDEEIKIMNDHYPYEPIEEFIDLLNNRSRHAVINMAIKLGLQSYLMWKKEDVNFLINNWQKLSDYDIALKLGKSQLCVKTKRINMGLLRIDRNNKNYENLSKYLRSNNHKWKEDSMASCNYQCIITGSKDFEIHHLINVSTIIELTLHNLSIEYKKFEDYTDNELVAILDEFLKIQKDYPLGVCIQKDLHVLFHSLYGQQNNNIEQFNNFIQEYKKGSYNKYIQNKSFTKCVETAGVA